MFGLIQQLQAFLSGKKTYIIAIAAIFAALAAYAEGTIDFVHLLEALFAAIGTMSIRAAVTKSGPATPK